PPGSPPRPPRADPRLVRCASRLNEEGTKSRKGPEELRLLYVEDHEVFRAGTIARYLSAHQVTNASTLAETRAVLASEQFDAVLLDYDLPDGKGTEPLDDLRRFGLSGRVVAVSSVDEQNTLRVAAGAFAAVSKMRFSRIVEVLEELGQQL